MTGAALKVAACDVWRRVATCLSSFLTAHAGSTPLETKWRAPRRKRGRTCQRALQVQHITLPQCRVPPTATSRRPRKRVCVYWRGVAKRLCPRRAYLTVLAKSSARADSAPTPAVRDGAYHTGRHFKYVPFPTVCADCAPSGRDPINQPRIIRNTGFYLPTPTTKSHTKVSLPSARAIDCATPFLLFRVTLHYNPLIP